MACRHGCCLGHQGLANQSTTLGLMTAQTMPKAMLQLGSAGLIALAGLGGQSKAAPLPPCPAAVQAQADRALANLEQRHHCLLVLP